MGKLTSTASNVGHFETYRRALERRPVFRVGTIVFFGFFGVFPLIIPGPSSFVLGCVSVFMSLAHLIVPLFSPERARKRLLASATREGLPQEDGLVTLIGIAGEAGPLLAAPYSQRACIAYWSRIVTPDSDDESKDDFLDHENKREICDFAIDVGSERVFVEAAQAYFAFDRAHSEIVRRDKQRTCVPAIPANRTPTRFEEVIIRPGDRVVVRGIFMSEGGDNPFRRSFRLTPGPHQRVMVAVADEAP